MIAAMKAKDDLRVQTLRGAMAAFTNELVSKGRKPTEELDDAGAISVLKRLAKQRKEAAAEYTKGARPELAEKESKELAILEAYLPQTMDRASIEKVAKAKMAEFGITDASGVGLPAARAAQVGKLTGAVMKELAGQADGNDVKAVVTALLL